MKVRPVAGTRIKAVDITPVSDGDLTFHLTLTDTEGHKLPFVLDQDVMGQLLDGHINALGLMMLHALPTRGLQT